MAFSATHAPVHATGATIVADRKGVAPSKSILAGAKATKVARTVTIWKPAAELYAFWRDFEHLPQIAKHPLSILVRSSVESHWTLTVPPGDMRLDWDALIINDEHARLIAWRSKDGSEISHAGTVRFDPAPGDQGTEVTVTIEYVPPGGPAGAWIAKISADEAGQHLATTLRRFKALMEAGEIPTIDGQPVGEPQRSKLR